MIAGPTELKALIARTGFVQGPMGACIGMRFALLWLRCVGPVLLHTMDTMNHFFLGVENVACGVDARSVSRDTRKTMVRISYVRYFHVTCCA